MLNKLAVLSCGILFGLGLIVSQMVNPQKVIAFLDVTGQWDPSLALVMAGALATLGFMQRFILKRPTPLLTPTFHLPTQITIDAKLILGATLFGLGWGMIGFCPGPAVVAIVYGHWETWVFSCPCYSGMWFFSLFHKPE